MKKKLKTCLILTLCLWLLCAPAFAQTVPEMVQAPAHVTERFTSATGKTVIEVDARVLVPQAEGAFLFPVEIKVFEKKDVQNLAPLIAPDAVWDKQESIHTLGGIKQVFYPWKVFDKQLDKSIKVSGGGFFLPGGQCFSTMLYSQIRLDDEYRTKGTVNYLVGDGREIAGDGIKGHALTTQQAEDIAQTFLSKVTDEPFSLFTMAAISGKVFDDELMLSNQHWKGESYMAVFTRQVAGMPILRAYPALNPYDRNDIYAVPVGYEYIALVMDEAGQITHFAWYHRYAIDEADTACKLQPFDNILDIAGKILPLKFAGLEKEEDQLVRINRKQLGYMSVLQRDGNQAFQLTPVWNFYGVDERNFEKYPHRTDLNQAHLTINAIDGTVIDLEYGY